MGDDDDDDDDVLLLGNVVNMLTLFGPGYFGVGKDRGADSAAP